MFLIKTIEWKNDKVVMLDQRLLPTKEVYITCEDYVQVAQAIKNMAIRGAPAIGVAAAMGLALAAQGFGVNNFDTFYEKVLTAANRLANARPTAVNPFWALERMKAKILSNKEKPVPELIEILKVEALKIYHEDIESNRAIGRLGQELLKDGDTVLTHCNAGALATAGYGTALGIIYSAHDAGKQISVIADETRPLLQGARLTAWEMQKHGIKTTVITDNMAGLVMRQGLVNAIIVGADRIAANGDVANKIGTYTVAVLAQKHAIPFYVAAPLSTIDRTITDGTLIPIEERDHNEIRKIGTTQITPDLIEIINPAFDVTPAELITAIITEKGIAKAPYSESIANFFKL
ncbi:MAG: S-methyl-5-thioribose-1-phosphate isomerase [Pseudomonadota bacterium]